MNYKFLSTVSLSFSAFFQGVYGTPEKPNFQDDVYPLFEQSCNSCHNPDKAKGGLDLTSMPGILSGGSSGDSVVPGDGANSYLYKLVARLEKPYMPREKEKLPQPQIDIIKKWIDLGLLPTATGKAIKKKTSTLNLALGEVPTGKPKGPPPMPLHLSLEPAVTTPRPAAISAMASNPWSPLVALSGQKQVILYHSDSREMLGILPYPEGFVESLVFSRNGLLLLAGGGQGGKSGRMVAWDVKTGKRLLAMGEEYDTILASDVSADQSFIALGGPAKRVKVYDLASGEILHNLKKHSEWVTALSFSPDGVLLATGDRNGGLHVWEAQSGNLFYTLDGHKKAITGLSWRADSNLLASASEEGSIRTWEMFNGKQVRTWTAHGGGSLSVDFDKKGNLVTAGRDKTVKLWNPSGAAIRTISGFPEMVMEARYSHDGSRIITGDWTGAVSVWNAADGKKQGDLSASPPTIASHISSALKLVDERKTAAAGAKVKHAPLAQALAAANAKLAEAKKTAANAAAAHKATDTALAAAKVALAQATANRDKAKTVKDTRQVARDKTAKQLADAQAAQKSHKTQGDDWGKRSSFRSEQVSLLRETHRKAKEALAGIPEDVGLKDAVAKQEQALAAMDNAFVQARDKTAGHLANAETFSKQATAHASALTAAENAFKAAETALAAHEKTRIEKDSAIKVATADQTAKLAANNTANSALAQQTKEQVTATEAEKAPAQNLRDAEAVLATAVRSAAKWQAETINVERHLELGKLDDLQNELNGLAAIAAEAKALHDAALAALEAARKALIEVPVKIKAKEQILAKQQSAMAIETNNLEKARKDSTEKEGFLNQVQTLATATKAKAAAEAANAELAAANAKFGETLALLRKDLTNSNSAITAQESKLKGAQTTVSQAEADLNQTRKLTQDAPKVVEEKLKVSKQTETKLGETTGVLETFKVQVTAQQAKSDSLFKKYLESLPK
jgi:hypothetical protein